MTNSFFEVLRPGLIQFSKIWGRKNYYHIGLPFSGAMDQRNFLISNRLVNNPDNEAVIEFAYQGPLLKVNSRKIIFAVTGDVNFKIIKANGTSLEGECYVTYSLENNDQLDIISTNKFLFMVILL